MSHYTLAWHDQQDVEHHICEYADNAFEAAEYAKLSNDEMRRTFNRFCKFKDENP